MATHRVGATLMLEPSSLLGISVTRSTAGVRAMTGTTRLCDMNGICMKGFLTGGMVQRAILLDSIIFSGI